MVMLSSPMTEAQNEHGHLISTHVTALIKITKLLKCILIVLMQALPPGSHSGGVGLTTLWHLQSYRSVSQASTQCTVASSKAPVYSILLGIGLITDNNGQIERYWAFMDFWRS